MKQVPVHIIENDLTKASGVILNILRFDLYNEYAPGNKFFKLKYNLQFASENCFETVLTFGGAYSNHISATAAACKKEGIKSIGVIRGKQQFLSSTLQEATNNGMELFFISREDYRKKDEESFISDLRKRFGRFHLVPEGGNNILGVRGAEEMMNHCPGSTTHICLPCGTGATLAGVINGLQDHQTALGFSVLKGYSSLTNDVKRWLNEKGLKQQWRIIDDYHFGGYAKAPEELKSFFLEFKKQFGIELDLVYTSKMMCGIFDLIRKHHFPEDSVITAFHTGGTQGNRGFGF